jgi:hypothetical protein
VLDGLGIESRCGARFSAPVQTGSGTHPASYTMGSGSFPEVKQPGRGVNHPPTRNAEVKEKVELYPSSTLLLSWPVIGLTVPSPFYLYPSLLLAQLAYRGADKFLARSGRKQATATEDFEFHISYL